MSQKSGSVSGSDLGSTSSFRGFAAYFGVRRSFGFFDDGRLEVFERGRAEGLGDAGLLCSVDLQGARISGGDSGPARCGMRARESRGSAPEAPRSTRGAASRGEGECADLSFGTLSLTERWFELAQAHGR